MPLVAMVTGALRRMRHPRITVRGRLALLYGSVFLASGIALLAITYVLVDGAIGRIAGVPVPAGRMPGSLLPHHMKAATVRVPAAVSRLLAAQRTVDLHSLLLGSSIALGVMTVASVLLGWLVAGRILRPLRTITNTARHISQDSLDQRLALQGPRDELNDLGEVIDGLLERLQTAFEAQRHFVANAAHELRAPLTLERATLQVTSPIRGSPSARCARPAKRSSTTGGSKSSSSRHCSPWPAASAAWTANSPSISP